MLNVSEVISSLWYAIIAAVLTSIIVWVVKGSRMQATIASGLAAIVVFCISLASFYYGSP